MDLLTRSGVARRRKQNKEGIRGERKGGIWENVVRNLGKCTSTCRYQDKHQCTPTRSRPSREIQTVVRTSEQDGVVTMATDVDLARRLTEKVLPTAHLGH